MSDFVHRKLWIPIDPNSDADVITLNGGPGKLFKGGEAMLCIALFDVMPKSVSEPGTFLNHSLLASFLAKIRSGSYAGSLLLDSSSGATVTIDPSITKEQFINKQRAPIEIYLPSAITAIAAETHYITFTGATTDTPAQPDGFGRGRIIVEDIGIGAADSVAPANAQAATTDMMNAALQQCVKYGKNPAGKSFSLTSANGAFGRLKYTSDDGEDASELLTY